MNPFLRRYLKLGWHLMPCHYRSKAGLMRWDKASANPRQVPAWAKRWPYAKRAVLCDPESGGLVIDVDVMARHGELMTCHRKRGLPRAPQVLSGSAGGA